MSSDTTTRAQIIPELLTSREAARLAGVGDRTWWRWSRSGIAPKPIKIGGGKRAAVRYSREALLRWIRNGCPHCGGGAGQ